MYKCACVYEWCVTVCDDVPLPPPLPPSPYVSDPPGVAIPLDLIITGDRLVISEEVLGRGRRGIVFRATLDATTPCAVKVREGTQGWVMDGGVACVPTSAHPAHHLRVLFARVACVHMAVVCRSVCVQWVSTLHVLVGVRGGNLMYPAACACLSIGGISGALLSIYCAWLR
jgi:hypothetical protein